MAPIIAHSVQVPEAYGEVFNIGADHPYTILELAQLVQEAMGHQTGIKHLPARNEVKHAISDHSKAKTAFGQLELVPLKEGLERMVGWAKEAGHQELSVFGAIEIARNLPPSWTDVSGEIATRRSQS